MLELILPPIILVLVLVFLIYFFSRRLPELQTRIDLNETLAVEQSGGVWRDRVKHAALSLLEKGVRRWKVGLLKAHNQAHELTDTLRKRRQASRERLLRSEEIKQQEHHEELFSEAEKAIHHEGLQFPTQEQKRAPMSENPVFTRKRAFSARAVERDAHEFQLQQPVYPSAEQDDVAKQLLEKKQKEAELALQEKQNNEQLEASLIERIVTNPKDVEAYERLGDHYMDQGSLVDAKECYRQVLKLSPVNRLVKIKIRRLERVLEKR